MGTYGLRVPVSRVGYVPEAQGGLPPGPHVLYVLGTRTSLRRWVRTAYCGTPGQRQHGHRIPPNQRFHHMSDEDIHFECSFANQWPAAIVGWKMPENGDCRGLVSLNLVQAVLNRIVRK